MRSNIEEALHCLKISSHSGNRRKQSYEENVEALKFHNSTKRNARPGQLIQRLARIPLGDIDLRA
ncbi:MAG: hypothetical protein CMO47_10615 [Verrucomicrobiales bacterium]|nr:hypothetical protein [Verrucomicrobiales bacterium]